MQIKELNQILEHLEMDLRTVKNENYHPRCHDLLEMIVSEDIPELIAFVKKVNHLFDYTLPDGSGDQYRGFKICHESLKKDLYGQ